MSEPQNYLLDADVLLHIKDRRDSESIYTGVIDLAKKGRAKTVRQVFGELKRRPTVHKLITQHRKSFEIPAALQFVEPVSDLIEYLQENAPYLCEVAGGKHPDPADPWLIAVAKVHGFTLVTDEKQNSSVKIPAACKLPKIKCRCISGPHFLFEAGVVRELKPEHISPAAFYGQGE